MQSGSPIEIFPVTVRLGATLFFVLLNGFFVAAEFALVKVRRSRIQALADSGNRSAPWPPIISSIISTSTCPPASSASPCPA